MARKSKKKSRSGGGRRRMGAAKSDIMDEIISVALATGAAVGTNYVATLFPKVKPVWIGAGGIAAGILLRIQKNPMLKTVGTGIAVGGGIQLAHGLGIINGIGQIRRPLVLNTSNGRELNGYNNVRQIGRANMVNNYPSPGSVGKAARRYAGSGQ